MNHPVICIVGPTASGKTDLSQRVAVALDGEVVSADSMQVYRGMDIGTGKISPDERLVAHHGLDLVDPGMPFSAALFQRYARERFADIDRRGKTCILCGGTGFYVRAAIDDYDFPAGEQLDNPLRQRYAALARRQGPEVVWNELSARDPRSAAIIPQNDVKRVIRALELLEEGTSYHAQKQALATIPRLIPAVFIGLQVDPGQLANRIERRVDAMFEQGLVEEVEGLLEKGFREGITANQAIGYKEIVSALDGDITLDEARDAIKVATRRYAKRQRTWFRKDSRIHWLDATRLNLDDMTCEALAIVAKIEPSDSEGGRQCLNLAHS